MPSHLWKFFQSRLVAIATLFVLVLIVVSTTNAEVRTQFRPIALTGEPVQDAFFTRFFDPVLNQAGQVAFRAFTTSSDGSNGQSDGIFASDDGQLRIVQLIGNQVPGAPAGVVVESFGRHIINNQGDVAIAARLDGPGFPFNDDDVFLSEVDGALNIAARDNALLTNIDGQPIGRTQVNARLLEVYNSLGQVAISAKLDFPFDGAILIGSRDSFATAIYTGQPLPDFPESPDVRSGNLPQLNDQGEFVVRVQLDQNSSAVLVGKPGMVRTVVRSGMNVPGLDDGIRIGFLGTDPGINGAGDTVAIANLEGEGVNEFNNQAILTEVDGQLETRLRIDDPVTGLPPNVGLYEINQFSLLMNNDADLTFKAELIGDFVNDSNDDALFVHRDGEPRLVVREGDRSPLRPETRLGGLPYHRIGDPLINNRGDVVFSASMSRDGINASQGGIFLYDRQGILHTIAFSGDSIDVNPDPLIEDFRTIEGIGTAGRSNGMDGRQARFNDAGQLALLLSFTDGSSGVFLVSVNQIPEPSMALLAAVMVITLLFERHRRTE